MGKTVMGGGFRWGHPSYFVRWGHGFFAFLWTSNYMSEYWIEIPRYRDNNLKWTWWADFVNKKRAGDIPVDVPGYMNAKFQTNLEKRWWRHHGREYDGFPPPDDE